MDLEKGRKAVASDVQVEVGLGLKRSRAVTLDGSSGTEKSTIRRCDQENVSYPVNLSPEGYGLGGHSGLNRGMIASSLLLASPLERPAVR